MSWLGAIGTGITKGVEAIGGAVKNVGGGLYDMYKSVSKEAIGTGIDLFKAYNAYDSNKNMQSMAKKQMDEFMKSNARAEAERQRQIGKEKTQEEGMASAFNNAFNIG